MAGMFGFWSRHKANLTAARAGRNELLRQRDIALDERNELLDQRNKALNEREAFLAVKFALCLDQKPNMLAIPRLPPRNLSLSESSDC